MESVNELHQYLLASEKSLLQGEVCSTDTDLTGLLVSLQEDKPKYTEKFKMFWLLRYLISKR